MTKLNKPLNEFWTLSIEVLWAYEHFRTDASLDDEAPKSRYIRLTF